MTCKRGDMVDIRRTDGEYFGLLVEWFLTIGLVTLGARVCVSVSVCIVCCGEFEFPDVDLVAVTGRGENFGIGIINVNGRFGAIGIGGWC